MDRWLGGDGDITLELVPPEPPQPRIGIVEGFARLPRQEMELRPPEERREDALPLSQGFTCQQAKCESGRCLQCDLRLQIQPEKLWSAYGGG